MFLQPSAPLGAPYVLTHQIVPPTKTLTCGKGRILARKSRGPALSFSSATQEGCDLEQVTSTLWICFLICKMKCWISSVTLTPRTKVRNSQAACSHIFCRAPHHIHCHRCLCRLHHPQCLHHYHPKRLLIATSIRPPGPPVAPASPGSEAIQAKTGLCLLESLSTAFIWKHKVKVAQPCPTLCNPMDCSPPGSSIHGILKARILEWIAVLFSQDLPNPGIELRSPALQADSLPSEPPRMPENTRVGR